jgi:hypothetical protein
MPGLVVSSTLENTKTVSLCTDTEGSWKVFTAESLECDTFRLHEHRNLDARQVHKMVHDLLEISIPKPVLEKLKIPSLKDLYSESMEKKLKGYWIGAANGQDDLGNLQLRFVSLQKEGEEWLLHYVCSEDLLSSSRKYPVHTLPSFKEEEIYKTLEKLDPFIDPIDLQELFAQNKHPEISHLSKLFLQQMEAST